MPGGRPSKYTQKLADEICALLAEGRSLRTICLADNMPDKRSVFRWLRTNDEFCHQYARAKEESADALTEDMLDISDNSVNDYLITLADAIREKPSSEWTEEDIKVLAIKAAPEQIQRSRLRVDTRKWIASKLKPKKYGESSQIALTGKDGGPIETKALQIGFVGSAEET